MARVADDYAWLKDANWQKVLRDPALLQPDIRAYLEAENRYAEDDPRADRRRCRRRWSPRCAAASRRTIRACRSRTGRSPISGSIRQGGQHELIGRTPRDGGDVQIILDGDALAKASDYFNFGGTPAFARPSARSLERRPARLGILHHPRAQLGRPARTCPTSSTQTGGSVVWGREFDVLLLRPARRQSPAAAGLSAIAWARRRATTCWSTRRRTTAGSRVSRKAPAAASASSPPATRRPPSAG